MKDRINSIEKEIREFLERTFYSSKYLDALVRNLDKFNDEELSDLLIFMDNLRIKEYAELVRIWELPHINDNMWHQYKLLRLKDFPEQKLLEDAWIKFRDTIREYLKLRKRKVHNENRDKAAAKRIERLHKRLGTTSNNSGNG